MPKGPTNVDRDRTIADLISRNRSLMARLDEMGMVINNHADVLRRFGQQLDALTLEASLSNGVNPHAEA